VADYDAGLRVVDVSHPDSLVEVGYYDTPGNAKGVAVSGSYAYVAATIYGLRVVDVSDPENPVEIGYYDTPGYAQGVAISSSYAYVADFDAGLRVVDVSDPENPVEAGYYDTPNSASGVAVSGNYAYVADRGAGLRVINVSNPQSPGEVGYYNTPGTAGGVAVSGNYAYVADFYYFEIFDCSQAMPVPNCDPMKMPVIYSLLPAYPNPFNSTTRLSYSVAAGGRVQLVVYDLLGRQVGTLVDRTLSQGTYSTTWDACNLASGIYFCRMSVKTPDGKAGGFQQVQKLTLLK